MVVGGKEHKKKHSQEWHFEILAMIGLWNSLLLAKMMVFIMHLCGRIYMSCSLLISHVLIGINGHIKRKYDQRLMGKHVGLCSISHSLLYDSHG